MAQVRDLSGGLPKYLSRMKACGVSGSLLKCGSISVILKPDRECRNAACKLVIIPEAKPGFRSRDRGGGGER